MLKSVIETVLLSTHNICLGWEIRKLNPYIVCASNWVMRLHAHFICLIWFLTSQSTIFQSCWDRSSWVEPVLSKDKCVLLKNTTKSHQRGSNLRPLGLESSTLPLSMPVWTYNVHIYYLKLSHVVWLIHRGLACLDPNWQLVSLLLKKEFFKILILKKKTSGDNKNACKFTQHAKS